MPTKKLTWSKNPLNEALDGLYPIVDTNKNYRVFSAYTDVDTGFGMVNTSHRPEAGDAYYKYASQYWEYSTRLCWFGGDASSFRITILSAPTGAYIGTGGTVQTATRTIDSYATGVYNHTRPEKWATVSCQFNAGDVGTTKKFKVLVEDNKGRTLIFRWSVTIDESKFVYADSTGGLDTNSGTWALPKQTFNNVFTQTGKIAVYKTAGTYTVSPGSGSLSDASNVVKCHIGLVPGVKFNMSTTQFGGSGANNDISFINIEFDGHISSSNNPRVFNFGSKVARHLFWKCKWSNVGVGVLHDDNPTCAFFANIAGAADNQPTLPMGNSHNYINIIGCSTDTTVATQMACLFSTNYVCIEENTYIAPNNAPLSSNNGGMGIHAKASCNYITMRFNYLQGMVNNGSTVGAGLIGFSNQAGYQCKNQEVAYNVIKPINCKGIVFGGNQLVAGVAGQSVGSENVYIYRNTIIAATNEACIGISNWLADEPFNISNNLCVTTGTAVYTVGTTGTAYVNSGDNTAKAASFVDGSNKISTANRATNLGKIGAEIASTLVI